MNTQPAEDDRAPSEALERDREETLRLILDAAAAITYEWEISLDQVRRLHSSEPTFPATENTHDRFADIVARVHPEDRDLFRANVSEAVKSSAYRSEHRIIRPDGAIVWLHERGRVEKDVAGQPKRLLGISFDITARKNLELDLEKALGLANAANEAKSAFIANMSHEIRTPMSTVIGMLEVLLRTSLAEQQRDHVTTALDSSRDLLHVLNDILDTSAIEAGRVSIHEAPFSIRKLLTEKHAMFALRAAQKGLSLTATVAADVPEWQVADERRIRQVMSNLIGNSLKYTDSGSVEVSASFDAERAMLRIEVSDTGIGINEEAQRDLFQPFVQADATRSRRYGGSGLGLNISRKLVELMRGEIGVASRIGQGSKFWFEIPAPECEAADQGGGDDPMDMAVPSLRILVAEDNAAAQRIIEALLTAMGHTATMVDNGAPAVAEVASGQYDVVLMDVMMPGMDGATAARRIRELGGRAGGIPIIALTADIVFGSDGRHLVAGMTDYVSKPIDVALLVAALKRASVFKSTDSA